MRACRWMLVYCLGLGSPCAAQTTLPPVSVTAPAYARHYGGYLISGVGDVLGCVVGGVGDVLGGIGSAAGHVGDFLASLW